MEQMYKGIPFSPTATLTANISVTDAIIPVSDVDAFPDAPSIATIGTDTTAETIIYTAKTATALTGCTRGVEGTAKDWQTDEIIGRNFTAKDHADIIKNIENLDNNKLDATFKVDVVNTTNTTVEGKALDARQNNPSITGTLAQKVDSNTQQISVLSAANRVEEVIRKMQNGANIKIVCYGDSVTAGTDAENNTQLAPEEYRYPKILGDLLTNLTRVPNTVINKGVPGATSTDLLNNFEDVLSLNPDMVILMCGINDFGTNTTVDTFKNNLNKMINLCKKNNIAILLLTPTQLYSYSGSINFVQYVNACEDIAKNTGVRCVNTNYIFDLMLTKGKCAQSYICPDHIHPRKELYKCIAHLIMKELFNVFVAKDYSWLPVVNTHFAYSSCTSIFNSFTQNFIDAYVLSPGNSLECVIVPFFIEKDTNISMLHSKSPTGGNTNILIDGGTLSVPIDYKSSVEDNNVITQIATITDLGYHTLEIYGGLTVGGSVSIQAVYLS